MILSLAQRKREWKKREKQSPAGNKRIREKRQEFVFLPLAYKPLPLFAVVYRRNKRLDGRYDNIRVNARTPAYGAVRVGNADERRRLGF